MSPVAIGSWCMDHPVLERIGAYRLAKHLGANDTVQVYLAREDGSLGPSRAVVLKIVPNLTAEDALRANELRREAPALRRLNHPAIVRLLRFFEHEHALVFVLEYVDGISLADLLRTDEPEGRHPF